MRGPLLLDPLLLGAGDGYDLVAERGDPDQPGATVRRVGDALDVTGPFEVVDERRRRLLGDLRAVGEHAEPGAFRVDAGGQPALSDGELGVPGGAYGVVDPTRRIPLGDEHQQAGRQFPGH